MISNVETYLAIAREAHAEMQKFDSESRRPKPDGSPGHIVTFDPNHRSFKHAIIAIAFSGMYFEAAVYLMARHKFSKTKAAKIDRMPYEQRLVEIGVSDQSLVDAATALREVRKDLVHEKAIMPEELKMATCHFAQKSADQAINFVNKLHGLLSGAP